jgi:DNA-binding NtrC family response regulator
MAQRLLVVEDDPAVRRSLAETLEAEGVEVHLASTAEEALTRLAEVAPEVVLTDVRMPGMDGRSLLRVLRERVPDVAVVVMTAFDEMPTVVQAMRDGAFEFIVARPPGPSPSRRTGWHDGWNPHPRTGAVARLRPTRCHARLP